MTTTKKLYRVRLLPNSHVSQDKQTLGYLATNNRIGVYGKAYAIKLAYEYHGVIEPNEQEVGRHDTIGFYSYEVYPSHQADFFAPLPYTDMEIGTEVNFAELGFSKKQFFGSVIGTSTYSPKRTVKLEAISSIDKAVIKHNEHKIKIFPNGFASWQETHFEITRHIISELNKTLPNGPISEAMNNKGLGGVYELSEKMTDKFETENKDREWDGGFYDAIERFIKVNI